MKIDLIAARDDFSAYAQQYCDDNNKHHKCNLKKHHTFRVAENCRYLAQQSNMSADEVDLAEMIGIFHDIGRFEQWRRFGSFEDANIDHAWLSSEILRESGHIGDYIDARDYDELIYNVIANHSKLNVPENITAEERRYLDVLRDADKMDILYQGVFFFDKTPEEKEQVISSHVSKRCYDEFFEEHLIDKTGIAISTIDSYILKMAFIYDLHTDAAADFIFAQELIPKMARRFKMRDENDAAMLEKIASKAQQVLAKRIEKSGFCLTTAKD